MTGRSSATELDQRPGEMEQRKETLPADMYSVVAYSPVEALNLVTQAGLAKAAMPWADLIVKSFMGGLFISLGSAFDLIVVGGAPGLRASNPSLVTLIGAFVFPIGFVLIILTNSELATSNMFIMAYTTVQRRTSILALLRSWIVSYILNLAGCLFFAGFLTWWTDSLSSDVQKIYSVANAETRVNLPSYWSVNFLRGIGCNWLVGLAFFLAMESKDQVSKIYSIWIPIWAFVGLGYQHSIANFFIVPIGMFYGTSFGVGAFIYKSVIPTTLGNIVGGAVFVGCAYWFLYGRDGTAAAHTSQAESSHRHGERPTNTGIRGMMGRRQATHAGEAV